MLSDGELARAIRALPVLQTATSSQLDEFRQTAYVAHVPAGQNVFVEGDRVGAIPLLITGVVRVYQVGQTGREVTLYRFRPGESCVLTANAILTGQAFPAVATVEDDVEAVMVPSPVFRGWVKQHDQWRQFFVDLVAQRLASVMSVVDEVAFKRLDERVAALLAGRARPSPVVRITHQELADELGSAREAVSRVLEDLAGRELIEVRRGSIAVLDTPALEALGRTVT